MNRERIVFLTIAIIAVGAAFWYRGQVLGGPKEDEKLNLLIVNGGSGPYWQLIADGARAASEKFGANLKIIAPESEEDEAEQTKILLNLVANTYDGVAVSPLDAEKQTRAINELTKNAIVVTVDSDAPLSMRSTYVGSHNLAAGRKCARLLKEALPNGGKVAVLMVNLTKDNLKQRKTGFEEGLNGDPDEGPDVGSDEGTDVGVESVSNIEVVDYLIDDSDNERCETQLREFLDAHSDLAGLVGMNAQYGGIMLRVLDDVGRLDQIKLVTFDDNEETLKGIEDGHIYATVAQDPFYYGFEAVRHLSMLCRQETMQLPSPGASNSLTVATIIVNKDNVAEHRRSRESRSKQVQDPGQKVASE